MWNYVLLGFFFVFVYIHLIHWDFKACVVCAAGVKCVYSLYCQKINTGKNSAVKSAVGQETGEPDSVSRSNTIFNICFSENSFFQPRPKNKFCKQSNSKSFGSSRRKPSSRFISATSSSDSN